MSNLTIFKQSGAISTSGARELTGLAKIFAATSNMRRIATNTNGTFKRIINGEQIGNAIRGEFNAIIVDALPKVSRTFYAGKYDPNAKATLPDCWSNLGDKPEPAAANKQHSNCAECPQNTKGSGENGGRACRFQRRIAILLEGDPTGEVYQFNVPAKSLFGKGNGNVHPFESYVKYLIGNRESPDTVVTNISYDLNADSMELLFTPLRGISDEEYELVTAAQADPETKRYVQLTVSADSAKAEPKQVAAKPAPKPVVTRSDEPDEDDAPVIAPVKRSAKPAEKATVVTGDLATIVHAWGDTNDDGAED